LPTPRAHLIAPGGTRDSWAADGGGLRQLTDAGGIPSDYSPDGEQVVFLGEDANAGLTGGQACRSISTRALASAARYAWSTWSFLDIAIAAHGSERRYRRCGLHFYPRSSTPGKKSRYRA
jgi:hypothetical protein